MLVQFFRDGAGYALATTERQWSALTSLLYGQTTSVSDAQRLIQKLRDLATKEGRSQFSGDAVTVIVQGGEALLSNHLDSSEPSCKLALADLIGLVQAWQSYLQHDAPDQWQGPSSAVGRSIQPPQ